MRSDPGQRPLAHLVVLRDEVVNDEHLQAELPAQLPDVLQEAFDFPLVLLLEIGRLPEKPQAFHKQTKLNMQKSASRRPALAPGAL